MEQDDAVYEKTLNVIVGTRVEKKANGTLTFAAVTGAITLLGGFVGAYRFAPAWVWGSLLGIGLLLLRVGMSPRERSIRHQTENARIRVTPDGIDVDGRRIEVSSIAQAFYQPRAIGYESVRCVDPRGEVIFEATIDGEEDAVQFLRALGRDAEHNRVRFEILSTYAVNAGQRAIWFFGLFTITLLVVLMSTALSWGLPLAIALIIAFTLIPTIIMVAPGHLEIGADGLLFRWLWTRRFLPYETIKAVERIDTRIVVTLNDGSTTLIELPRPKQFPDDELRRDAILARISQARRSTRSSTSKVMTKELISRMRRGARDVKAWRSDLLRIRDVSYREAATPDDELLKLVEDGAAPEDARAAAAVLLRGNESLAPRVRIAAQAVASPRLRIALERAADKRASDHAIDEALMTLETEARSAWG